MNASLVLISGETRKVYPLTNMSTTIGRAPNNTIQLASTHVSRHHAVIEMGKNACEIVDLDSTNGTFVNGRKIDRHTTNVLANGAILRIGEYELRFETEDVQADAGRRTTIHELSFDTIQPTVVKTPTAGAIPGPILLEVPPAGIPVEQPSLDDEEEDVEAIEEEEPADDSAQPRP
ncbi:MAG: FHA domain-containing protein [Kiritimatiellae bacterium]|nr:FHA domain-containing protein [Kiritimatiellia bacterium]